MSVSDETLSVVNEGEALTLQQFLQDIYGRMVEKPNEPMLYFSNYGYNPSTKQRFEVVWGITLVDIKEQAKSNLN